MEIERSRKRAIWFFVLAGACLLALLDIVGSTPPHETFTSLGWELLAIGLCAAIGAWASWRATAGIMLVDRLKWEKKYPKMLARIARVTQGKFSIGRYGRDHNQHALTCPNCSGPYAVYIPRVTKQPPPPGARDMRKTQHTVIGPCCLSCNYVANDSDGLSRVLSKLEQEYDPLVGIMNRIADLDEELARIDVERRKLIEHKQRIEMVREPLGYRKLPQLPRRIDPFDTPMEELRTSCADASEENIFERIDRERRNA